MNTNERILVIGAGIAGLTAARQLQQHGFQVTLLEGRDRIGGRAWTDHTLGPPIDLGASWIHGVIGNPITNLAHTYHIPTCPTDYDHVSLYDPAGAPLPHAHFLRLQQQRQFIVAAMTALPIPMPADISLAEALQQVLAANPLPPAALPALRYSLRILWEHEDAADLEDLSWRYSQDFETFPGDDHFLPGGYGQLVNALAAGLDIRLNQVAQHVMVQKKGVTIVASHGIFAADRVICTLPLGVLQKGQITFTPPLPAAKQAAIHRLGMGLLNKIILAFPRQFWPAEPLQLGYLSEVDDTFDDFLNLALFTRHPLLLAFTSGRFAHSLEAQTDTQIVGGVMTVLRQLFGSDIPDPNAWRITRWGSDPFTYGSYSYVPVGAAPTDFDALAAPVADRLFFAGEATHRRCYATVHGAYLTGQREAQRILNIRSNSS